MKSYRALVVEDDERVMPSVEDALFSLGHEHDWVTNQADAQERLAATAFDYVLLDLQIPARPGRGGASIDCGLNLLRWMRKRKNGQCPPVIIMTGQTGACVDLTRELTENGAREFIAKPFPDRGRTLANVVRSVLETPSSGDDGSEWLTVKQCALMLLDDVSGLDLQKAKARVSWAAGAGKLKTNGKKGPGRRIERHSFSTWRLEQRERDLADADWQ
jgi:DNA-binding response OmpR family regulator